MAVLVYKLQNVVLEDTRRLYDFGAMYVKSPHTPLFNEDGSVRLLASARYDFATYFGSLSIAKWKRYTHVRDGFALHLRIKGSFQVWLVGCKHNYAANLCSRTTLLRKDCTSDGTAEVVVEFPTTDDDIVAFELITKDECVFYGAYYTGLVDESLVRPVRLNVVMTTFKKESYVRDNVALFEQLLASDEAVAKGLTVSVIDNGRTLQAPLSADYRIRLYANPNAGGAGGFARGMIEALDAEMQPTHLLMMDDDVNVLPEAFVRTHNLIAVVTPEYEEAFLSGAMLSMAWADAMGEDVGVIRINGVFGPVKPPRCMSDLSCIVANEATEVGDTDRQYAAFWFCCFPMTVVHRQGLTMPFFVRGDDAEFGLRESGRRFMTLNGICVWHMPFDRAKLNVFNEDYLAVRNELVIKATVDSCGCLDMHGMIEERFHNEICKFEYGHVEMLLDGLEHFLAGPEWLMKADPAQVLTEESAKKPKDEPLDVRLPVETLWPFEGSWPLAPREQQRFDRTYNFQMGSERRLRPPEAWGWMLNEFNVVHPIKIAYCRRILFFRDDRKTGHFTTMDRARFRELLERKKALMGRLDSEWGSMVEQWRAAKPQMTSVDFWRSYLGL